MKERYEGREGKARLVAAFADQELVLQKRTLARRLADVAILREYDTGGELYVQGEPGKNNLYFLISGSMELSVKGRPAATIQAKQAFGEFPILDPGLCYTVTIRAKEPSVVAEVSERRFGSIAKRHRKIWKNMARMLMKRLLRTHDSIEAVKTPRVFIGHGGNLLWTRVRDFLEKDLHLGTVSYESEARAGVSIVPILQQMLHQATFAVLVLTAEDLTVEGSRRARQNVIHEAGLFQGMLGFERAILLLQHGVEEFSNVDGLQHIVFEGDEIERAFHEMQRALRREGQIA